MDQMVADCGDVQLVPSSQINLIFRMGQDLRLSASIRGNSYFLASLGENLSSAFLIKHSRIAWRRLNISLVTDHAKRSRLGIDLATILYTGIIAVQPEYDVQFKIVDFKFFPNQKR